MALKKNRRTFTFFAVILLIACLVMTIGAAAVVMISRNPLAEKMALLTGAATPQATAVEAAETGATATPQELAQETTNPTATPVKEALPIVSSSACGAKGSLLLLFIGADFSGGVWPQGADAVRVVKVDYDHERIAVVAFPRDLWVQTRGLANQNLPATRLGLSYYYMKNATEGTEKHQATMATTMVGQALYDNFGLAPQHYLTVNMENMSGMVDAIGGVDIYNPEGFVSDRQVSFPAGPQNLNGSQAMEFVRTYQPGGDPARRQRQNLFVKALQNNMLNAGILIKLPELAARFNQSIMTDLTPQQITDLSCMAGAVPEGQQDYYEVSGDLVTARDTGEGLPVMDPKVDQIKAKLMEWLGE